MKQRQMRLGWRLSTGPRSKKARALILMSLVCLSLFGLSLAAPGQAWAQDFAAAGQHFAAAQDAFGQGQYKRAAEEYQVAYGITKDSALLFNIGESWQRAGDGPKALAAYRLYLKEQPGASDREEVEKRIASLEAAMLPPPAAPGTSGNAPIPPTPDSAATPPPGAAPGQSAPLGSEKTPPAAAGGVMAPTGKEPPAAGGTASIDVKAAPAAATAAPKPAGSRLRTAGWVTVAAAVALATAGAILGLGAQNRADELRRRTTVLVNNQPPVYDSDQREVYDSLMSEGNSYNTAGIALLSLAGAAAITGGALFIADWVRRPRPSEQPKAARLGLPTLAVGSGRAVLAIGGSF